MRPRRFLPSVSALTALEAVLATGSVTAAARELDLTQSSVSRLIQNMEAQLGRPLFVRHRKKLVATPAALEFGADMSRALDLMQRATMKLVTNPDGGALSVALLPTFGTRWLGPRLKGFLDANPGINMNLATRISQVSFDAEGFDAMIYFGQGDLPGVAQLKLFDETYTACISPALLAENPPQIPADLAAFGLLQLETRPNAWRDWFREQGEDAPRASGMVFDQFSMMIQAAISGLGVALLPSYLAQVEEEEARLIPLFSKSVQGRGAYWLAWPEKRETYAPLVAFRAWIAGQTLASEALAQGRLLAQGDIT
ncbi:MAG: LysR family transcriptional regulator [Maritimibacter sp.]